jgi:hypothetical protein
MGIIQTDKTTDIRSVDGRRVSVIDTLSFEVIETLDYPCALLEVTNKWTQ